MTWLSRLQTAWQDLPVDLRRLLIGALLAGLGLVTLAFVGPREVQLVAVAGLIGLFLAVQAIILWRLWRHNPEFRQARRAMLQGNFEEAVRLLEDSRAAGKLDPEGQTLLGNAYRQLSRLDESERVLRAAHEADPDSPFAAYGLGRTLLAQGRYEEAADLIAHALKRRGPATLLADLGHAQYRAGMNAAAQESLARADALELEPHRALLTCYLRWRLEGQPADEDLRKRLRRYDHGLETWRAEAERLRATPYGAALAEDVALLEKLIEG